MADLLKPLGLAALLALATPVLAQDAGDAEAPAEADSAPAAGDAAAPAQPEVYIDEVFTDWSRECVRRPEGSEGADPCWITQVLKDDNGRPFGKFSVRRVPPNGQAVAQADVAVSMELVPYLPAGMTLGIDKGLAKEYQYLFCMPTTGCMAQPNLSQADIDAFKAGDVLNMGFAIVARASELATISSPISLKGFTVGVQLSNRGQLAKEMLRQHAHERVALVRHLTGDALVENDPKRVHIHTVVQVLSGGLFGRHVFGRSENHAGFREFTTRSSIGFDVAHLRDAEIDDLDEVGHTVSRGEKDVLGLDVAVHDALFVGRRTARGNTEGRSRHARSGSIVDVPPEHVGEVLALEELHDEVAGAARRLAEIRDIDDVFVTDAGRALGLLAKTGNHLGAPGQVVTKDLDRHPFVDVAMSRPHTRGPYPPRRTRRSTTYRPARTVPMSGSSGSRGLDRHLRRRHETRGIDRAEHLPPTVIGSCMPDIPSSTPQLRASSPNSR